MTGEPLRLGQQLRAKYGPPPEHVAQIIRTQMRGARQDAAELREQRTAQDGR